ncbi:MAG: glycosyltransferase [Dysgonomonas sp.]|nr:glycosyltransferase [Dysgonomonas sp.]
MKFSFIIPMYNVEKFINKCLDSVQGQVHVSASQFEVIVVNDGSQDNSLLLAKKYEKRFMNFVIIDQSNQGLSAARNTGFDMAKGEYVWFIDSDDWIASDSLSILFKKIDMEKPDVIHFRAVNSFEDKLIERKKPFESIENSYSGIEILKCGYWSTCAPFYVYNRAFLLKNGLHFFSGIFHEDNEFTPRLLFFANKVCLLNDVLYYVYQNPNSITRSVNYKKSFDLIIVAQNLCDFSNKYICNKDVKRYFYRFISLNINNALYGTRGMDSCTKRKFQIELKKHKKLFQCLRNSDVMKYKIEGYLFMLTSNYIGVYNMMSYMKRA